MGLIQIHNHIANITTANKDDCWAASTAMVMRRHSITGTNHVKALAATAHVPLDKGTLPDASVPLLARAVRLGSHEFPVKDITLAQLESMLRRGPVVAFGFFNYPGSLPAFKHAVAIFALTGDGTPKGTKISLNDPASATNPFTDDWDDFINKVADITFVLSY
jgi:hypothetical protein